MSDIPCPFCDKMFRKVSTLQEHLFREEMPKNAWEICVKLARHHTAMTILDEYEQEKEAHAAISSYPK